MFHYDYKTENTCSQVISLDLDGNADQLAKAVRAAYEAERQAS